MRGRRPRGRVCGPPHPAHPPRRRCATRGGSSPRTCSRGERPWTAPRGASPCATRRGDDGARARGHRRRGEVHPRGARDGRPGGCHRGRGGARGGRAHRDPRGRPRAARGGRGRTPPLVARPRSAPRTRGPSRCRPTARRSRSPWKTRRGRRSSTTSRTAYATVRARGGGGAAARAGGVGGAGGVRWDCGACFSELLPTTVQGQRYDGQLWLTGDAHENFWSPAVTLHEFGHWVMSAWGTIPHEGGAHYLGVPTFPGRAWSEGWATWMSLRPARTTRGTTRSRAAPSSGGTSPSARSTTAPAGSAPTPTRRCCRPSTRTRSARSSGRCAVTPRWAPRGCSPRCARPA
jgi:hypothetical protein